MKQRGLHHYLLIYDPASDGEPEVREFRRPAPALKALRAAEERYRDRPSVQVVLLAADSLETIKVTHSNSWRSGAEELLELLERTA